MKVRFADLLLPLAILITPISAGIVTLYGRSTVVFDAFYNRVWLDENRSGLLAAILGAAMLVVVLTIASSRFQVEQFVGSRLFSTNFLMALFYVCLISVAANFSSWGLFGVVKVLIFFWITAVLFVSGISANSFKIASQLVLISYSAILMFAVVSPSLSWKPCREDKCTVAGSLLTSFFQSENSVSLYVLSTVYLMRFLQKRWQRGAGYVLALVLSSLSGSRVGLIAIALVVVVLVFRKTNVLVWAPITFFALSGAIFAFGTGADFTGRGAIFSAVREIWLSSPIFGVGPIATQLAFERGLVIGFVPYNEQTQVAHLLAQYGILVLILFVAVLGTLLRKRYLIRRSDSLLAITAPFLITSLAFVTESPASFTIDAPSFWVVAILFAKVVDKSSLEKLGPERIINSIG